MKKTLLTLIALSPLMAFSQVVDYEVVNQRNADRINSEYAQTKVKKKSKVREFFNLDHTYYPSKERYSNIEKDQINLLSCTRDLIQKHKGGYDGPEIAQKILLTAMEGNSLSTSSEVLGKAEAECRDAYKNLYNFKKKAINEDSYLKALRALPRSTEAEIKTAKVLSEFYTRENVVCKAVSVGAEAYALMGGGAGINTLKCLQADARVRKYVGIDLRFGGGIGAVANVAVHGEEGVISGSVGSVFGGERVEDFYAAGLTKLKDDGDYSEEDSHIMNLGLAATMIRVNGGVGLRVFNGKAKWARTLNILK